jgi:long-chain acyl-CoA synthetase
LKTSAAITNIVVYGSGEILFPVAIVLPVEKVVRGWAAEMGLECESLVELCQKKEIVDKMSGALLKAAKEGNLTKTEIPAKIYVDGSFGETGWLPDSGLVTDAFKLKRRQLNDHYKSEITSLTK